MGQDGANNQDAREHAEGGTWVAVRDAAAILGVSVDTVKRRMQRGELERRRETIPQGFRWLVRVDPVQVVDGEASVVSETLSQEVAVSSQSPDVVAALLHELEVRNQEIARLHDIVAALTHAVEQRPMLPTTADKGTEGSESAGENANVETYRGPTDTSTAGLLATLRRWLRRSD